MDNRRLIKNLNLAAEERILFLLRRYSLTYFWQAAAALVLLLLPWFLLYLLFSIATWGPILFILLLLIGVLAAARLYIAYYFNCLVVTDRRLIDFDQRGIWDRTISEVPLEHVHDLSYRRKGVVESIFNYGLIQYAIPPGRAKIVVKGIKDPQFICQQIIGWVEAARSAKSLATVRPVEGSIDTAASLKKLLNEMKAELGPVGFDKIIREVKGG
ncbi:MAG: PH domain-containing protein [Patescibacteria group bacterium]|jgi:hypothetical protein